MCTKNSASIWLADTCGEIKVDFFQDRDKLTLGLSRETSIRASKFCAENKFISSDENDSESVLDYLKQNLSFFQEWDQFQLNEFLFT